MKNIVILVPETAVPAAVFDPQYMFSAVNTFYQKAGLRHPFSIQLAGLSKKVSLNNGLVTIHTGQLLNNIKRADLIIIPALSGNLEAALQRNKKFIPWIVSQYRNGAEVASLCIGAFLLASTGLLKGKSCSTHWLFANEFRALFPDVELMSDKIITEQKGIYSSGGANSYWNLLLYLVERFTNRETAIMAGKSFLIDYGNSSQSPFTMFRGQKDHSDNEILKVQEYIEKHYREKITVAALSDKFNIGRRTFERRLRKATYNSVAEYLQRVKIEAAKKQMELTRKNVSEIMFDVGYSDTKAFRNIFRRITGMSPLEYRSRYNRDVAN